MRAGDGLRIERTGADGTVLVLTLDRPRVRNAIDDALLGALLAAVEAAPSEAGLGAVRAAAARCGTGRPPRTRRTT